jgi:hypothetical protein
MHQLRSANSKLAAFARRGFSTIRQDNSKINSGQRTALRRGQLVVWVIRSTHGEDGSLGQSPARDDSHSSEPLLHLPVKLWRLGCPATGTTSKMWKHALIRLTLLNF